MNAVRKRRPSEGHQAKACLECGVVKNTYYAKGLCNACYLRGFRARNPDKIRAYNAKNRAVHGEQFRAYDRMRSKKADRRKALNEGIAAWRLRNLDLDRANKRAYYRANREKSAEKKLRRNARTKCATPSWLTVEQRKQMARMYAERPPGYHVDHIVPLQGRSVSGLNVPWNLQHLSADENLRKWNKFHG